MDDRKYLEIEEAQIIWRNFSGAPSKYNADGERNFCVVLKDNVEYEKLIEEGWNAKVREPDGEDPLFYLKVKVNVDGKYPPRIKMIFGDKAVDVDRNNIELLDGADIRYCDMVISPYEWEMNGNKGIAAYLKELYVICNTSRIGEKYTQYDE